MANAAQAATSTKSTPNVRAGAAAAGSIRSSSGKANKSAGATNTDIASAPSSATSRQVDAIIGATRLNVTNTERSASTQGHAAVEYDVSNQMANVASVVTAPRACSHCGPCTIATTNRPAARQNRKPNRMPKCAPYAGMAAR